jgi:type VI secretion system protein ImpA
MDHSQLLPPLSIPDVCGPDPELTSALRENFSSLRTSIEAARKAWANRQRENPDPAIPPPDWYKVEELSLSLGASTKHLLSAVALSESLSFLRGLGGLADGLQLVYLWSVTWWKQLHPGGSDPEDIERRQTLIQELSNDRMTNRLKHIPLAEIFEMRGSRKVVLAGPYSLFDYEQSNVAEPADPSRAQSVKSTFAELEPLIREGTISQAQQCLEILARLGKFYEEKGYPLNLDELTGVLKQMLLILRVTAPAGGGAAAVEALPGEAADGGEAVAEGAGFENSRQAAYAQLNKVIAYFQRAEPSSPVPYFLMRAQRCIGKNFLEINEELGQDRVEIDRVLKPGYNPS